MLQFKIEELIRRIRASSVWDHFLSSRKDRHSVESPDPKSKQNWDLTAVQTKQAVAADFFKFIKWALEQLKKLQSKDSNF